MRERTRSLVDCHLCPGRTDPDVTWRFDGRPRRLVRAESDSESRIATDTEVVAVRNPNSQAIATNALDLINTYVADVDVNNLTITRIDP